MIIFRYIKIYKTRGRSSSWGVNIVSLCVYSAEIIITIIQLIMITPFHRDSFKFEKYFSSNSLLITINCHNFSLEFSAFPFLLASVSGKFTFCFVIKQYFLIIFLLISIFPATSFKKFFTRFSRDLAIGTQLGIVYQVLDFKSFGERPDITWFH